MSTATTTTALLRVCRADWLAQGYRESTWVEYESRLKRLLGTPTWPICPVVCSTWIGRAPRPRRGACGGGRCAPCARSSPRSTCCRRTPPPGCATQGARAAAGGRVRRAVRHGLRGHGRHGRSGGAGPGDLRHPGRGRVVDRYTYPTVPDHPRVDRSPREPCRVRANTGKSHLLEALGHAAIDRGAHVHRFSRPAAVA
jgi:hypothetical protein